MKIHIENKLYLESDPMQFILKEYSGTFNKETGAENFRVHGYYTKIEHAINKVLMMKINDSAAETLKELLEEVKTAKHFISGVLQEN